MTTQELALDFATKKHEGQLRKGSGGLPYITHPIAVAEIALELKKTRSEWQWLDDEILYIGAILHDIVEDTDTTEEEIRKLFGIEAAWIVGDLTKKDGEDYLTAINRAKSYVYSRIIKIADNIHNMSDLKEGTLKDKYRLSKYILESDIK